MIYRFGHCELDTQRLEIRLDGELQAVEPQVFSVLVHLIENREQVVSKDDLIDAVWDGRIVSDATLSSRISAARTAVGDTARKQAIIRTMPRRGFRFVADVHQDNVPGPAPHGAPPDAEAATQHTSDIPAEAGERPAIAVLPFNNLSGDPEQEYFSDGLSEDIITALSRFRSLFVTARNSTFAYKDKSPDVRDVARELGVRYVLEGSVRRSGPRMRITAQLADAGTGNQLWAQRYDRKLEDIFAVQDEVTEAIVAAIAPEISDVERARAQRKPPDNLDIWDLYQRALASFYASTEGGLRSSIGQFDTVNEVDPSFAPAFAMAAGARWRYVMHFEPDDSRGLLAQALDKAYEAITLDPRDPIGLWNAGRVHGMLGQHEAGVSKVEEAIALNPNDAMSRFILGEVLCCAGRAEEAIPHIDHAMRLSPRDIFRTGMMTIRAFALFDLERYEEAFEWVQRARLSSNPRSLTFALLTAVLVKLGRPEEARSALDDLLTHAPDMTCTKYRAISFGTPNAMARFVEALSEAGLPD